MDLRKQFDEVWISALVEDDESRVEHEAVRVVFHVVRVSVSAKTGVRLEQSHLMPALQNPGAGQTGYAGADDGDAHASWGLQAASSSPVAARGGREGTAESLWASA